MHKLIIMLFYGPIPLTESEGWKYEAGSDGNWYRYHQKAMTFTEAVKTCQEDDPRAHLMTMKSAETKEFIDSFYNKNPGQYWLGATDQDQEGKMY